jgi:hypothetical protein
MKFLSDKSNENRKAKLPDHIAPDLVLYKPAVTFIRDCSFITFVANETYYAIAFK